MAVSSDITGKRIIIAGEVNTGKTTLARAMMEVLCRGGLSGRVAVIDMAPDIPPDLAARRDLPGVGGKLAPHREDIVYLAAHVRAPRLTSKTEEEALLAAEENRAKIDRLFEGYLKSGRDILFINDVSMYLQAGRTSDLLRRIEPASTVVANGYYGSALGSGILSVREAEEMGKLIASFPFRVRTPVRSIEEALKGN